MKSAVNVEGLQTCSISEGHQEAIPVGLQSHRSLWENSSLIRPLLTLSCRPYGLSQSFGVILNKCFIFFKIAVILCFRNEDYPLHAKWLMTCNWKVVVLISPTCTFSSPTASKHQDDRKHQNNFLRANNGSKNLSFLWLWIRVCNFMFYLVLSLSAVYLIIMFFSILSLYFFVSVPVYFH